jgi:hypothetical protein
MYHNPNKVCSMKKRIRLMMSVLMLIAAESVTAVEIDTPLDAVQAMGHEMSEMRHMLETYAMIGTGVSFNLPREQLKASIKLYEEVIAAMEKRFPDAEIQKQIAVGRKGWQPVKKALTAALQTPPPSHEAMTKGAIFIHGNIRTVIKAMEAMKKYMLTQADFKAIKELNAAIEIDASARRLSAHYAMWMWGLPDPTIEAHWNKGMAIYRRSLAILKNAPYAKDPRFREQIAMVTKQLEFFEMIQRMADRKRFVPALVQVNAGKASAAAMAMAKTILESK